MDKSYELGYQKTNSKTFRVSKVLKDGFLRMVNGTYVKKIYGPLDNLERLK